MALHSDRVSLPKHDYFLGSRIAFTMAAITENNFASFIPFLLSGAEGLSPFEVLERIGVPAPTLEVLDSLGLDDDSRVTMDDTYNLQRFLYSYRWEILKVCKRNRQALFSYLLELDISEGQKIAIVDVGWSGSTQEAFELALKDLFSIDVYGYYFCLADTPERVKRSKLQSMKALLSSDNNDPDLIDLIFKNRVIIEVFFSAPHDTVIGLEKSHQGVSALKDVGRGSGIDNRNIVEKINEGSFAFFEAYDELVSLIRLPIDYQALAYPLIAFSTNADCHQSTIFSDLTNFDTWSSSQNKSTDLGGYN